MNHEEVGRNSPDVTLNIIVKDLLSFFNGFEGLHGVKRRIEKKCDIKKDPEHKCWPKDKIQQAWKETIKEDIKSRTRRHWARVIILQVVKSFVCDTCEQNTAQKNRHATTDEQGYATTPNSEDRSSQSKAEPNIVETDEQGYATTPNSEDRSSQSKAEPNIVETDEQGYATTPNSEDRIYQSKAELETVGAAGGDEQMFGAGKKVSKVSRLSEDSGVASGSQLSAFSTDVHDKENKDGEERVIKRRKKKQDGGLEEKKPRKFKVPKPGVSALNRPEKKKRKKLMKDSLSLAAMIRRFNREKEEIRKKNPAAAVKLIRAPPNTAAAAAVAPSNDLSMADLTSDPAVMSLLGGATENDMLQELMGDLDFGLLDSPGPSSPGQSENGTAAAQKAGAASRVQKMGLMPPPPPLPSSLPAPLLKRIEDLRVASRQFDMEGRKKFFTLDMNNILLDIELQVQEQPATVCAAVYSHLEAFVPCNKEALLKRLKKLSLNIQDDRLRTPLHKLKLAVCSVMPEQIVRYNMDCMAKVAKQQTEDCDRNGSEDDDDEKPGKRVMGPRKKFVWDDKLRSLLCNLVQVKLGCYELEGQSSLSPEDYLKVFMETEVKPLWPKGWMQARMLFKESRVAHSHLTGNTVKKRMLPAPKAKPKPQDSSALQRPSVSVDSATSPAIQRPRALSPPEPICLSDSLDEDLAAPSLDSISHALAMLGSVAKDLAQSNSPPSAELPKPPQSLLTNPHLSKKSGSTPSLPAPAPSVLSSMPASSVVKSVSVLPLVQRHSVIPAQRPSVTPPTKMGLSQVKPRPPPTASPLHAPQKILARKTVVAIPTGLIKTSNNSSARTLPAASSPSLLKVKSVQPFHVTPQGKNHASPKPGFITPMQATLTKSPHNPSSPIIKLTPTASPVITRTPTLPSMHQHASNSPGFHTGFIAGGYSAPVGQKSSSQGNSISGLTMTTVPVTKQPATSVSPVTGTVSHSQRHRQVGGANQGVKTITSVSTATASPLSQVSSSSALLGSAGPSLPLGFGMLGGLVPVSLPFQFPNLLNLPSSVVSTASTGASTNPSSSGFNLPQNVNQTQGGDLKRKNL
uniref:Ubinuclein-2-like n=1 Tax=Sinocyclocheilus grahami TaxID=75366 RepID=A0A672QBL5_SINGR